MQFTDFLVPASVGVAIVAILSVGFACLIHSIMVFAALQSYGLHRSYDTLQPAALRA
ncbi:MAG: hypothetical protein ACE10A_14185 [Acidiferrobacterales bacterium]|jgi:hypothetical protein